MACHSSRISPRVQENQSWWPVANSTPVQDLVGLTSAGLNVSKTNISESSSKRKNVSDSSIEQPNGLDVTNSLQSAQPSEPSGDSAQLRQVAASKNLTNMTTSIKHKSLLSDELPLCPPVPPDLCELVTVFTVLCRFHDLSLSVPVTVSTDYLCARIVTVSTECNTLPTVIGSTASY